MRPLTFVTLVALSATGCSIGPDYVRPDVQAPAAWRIDLPTATEVANTKWWEQFGDPALNDLIETALRENLDVQIAAARIDQFIGTLQATDAQAYPQLGYGADVSRTRASEEGQPPIPPGVNPYFTPYQATLCFGMAARSSMLTSLGSDFISQ